MEHFLEGTAPIRHWHINPNVKSNKKQILSSELTYQSLNRKLPSSQAKSDELAQMS